MTEGFDFDTVINRRVVPALKMHSMVLGDDGAELFAAGVADMDFAAPPVVQQALAQRAAHGVFGYEAMPDGLIPALASWLQTRHDWAIDPTHILRAPNVLNSLAMALNLFTDPGDGVILQPPVFFDFSNIIQENGRRVVPNPLRLRDGMYDMDFDGLERAASAPDVTMLFLCNPHNPVGRVWRIAELQRLAEICRAHDVLVVSDEIHGDIALNQHRYTPFASLSEADALNSVTCLSPAKSFNLAACCSGFTLVPDAARRAAFQAENSRLTVNKNNAFANAAMQAAYQSGGPWLDAVLRYLEGNVALVMERLTAMPQVRATPPEGTFLMWLDFRALQMSDECLTNFLRTRAKWAITRGISFGPEGAGFGRLNIACPRAELARALDGLKSALDGLSD